MMNVQFPFTRSKPTLVVSSIALKQNCFCGAGFDAQVPVLLNVEGDVSYETGTALLAEMRENWHADHYHQINPQLGDIIGTEVEADARTEVAGRSSLGFHLG